VGGQLLLADGSATDPDGSKGVDLKRELRRSVDLSALRNCQRDRQRPADDVRAIEVCDSLASQFARLCGLLASYRVS
jgi:hypothetical protein